METTLTLIGAITTLWIYFLSILVFLARLLQRDKLERAFGLFNLLAAIPLIYLWIGGLEVGRPALYYIQIGFMLVWNIVTLLVDYIFHIEFRDNLRWVIAYVVLFFAGTGGMLGVAALAGNSWMIAALVLFFIMAGLAFYQRAKTGK